MGVDRLSLNLLLCCVWVGNNMIAVWVGRWGDVSKDNNPSVSSHKFLLLCSLSLCLF